MDEDRHRGEKDEKANEKEEEKMEEKSWEEKWRRDPVNMGTWGAILIWLGVAFLLGNAGALGTWEPWAAAFTGAGVITLISVGIRLLIPEYRRPIFGGLILGLVFIGVGLGETISWSIIWPIIIIGIGVSILLGGFRRHR